jgi:hypothetical protein
MPLTSNEIEAANRAEATAVLIRAGYRVYRPEADVDGEDLIVRCPNGDLRLVQMKGRPTVEWKRYGKKQIWMLFPDPKGSKPGRPWFFVEHDRFYDWVKKRHGSTPKWAEAWSYPHVSTELREWLEPFIVRTELDRGEVE